MDERLAEWQTLEQAGAMEAYYGDELGFCLTSALPYGWHPPGVQVAPHPCNGHLFNVLV